MIIKYSNEGKVEWARSVGGSSWDEITSVSAINDGGIIAGGYFGSSTIEAGRYTLENKGSSDGLILKVQPNKGVPEVQELVVENKIKEFKITTDVKEIDNVKGGTISGEDKAPYETVKYGESSTKDIVMTPETGYEIISITVNGEEYEFEENPDGTYTMPDFTDVKEDKHVVVTYALKTNKITINKVDSKTKIPLSGVKFRLDQIDERTDPVNVIGEIVDNGLEYTLPDYNSEQTGVLGELTNNGTYYFEEQDGKYIPNNSGKGNTTANSYVEIDLSGLSGDYVAVVNASVSSESGYDYGYATVNSSTSAPVYSTTSGRFMYISGTSGSNTEDRDYPSSILEGGNKYYLHLGYRKDSSSNSGDDRVVINSIKVYKGTAREYHFAKTGDGKYESNNVGQDSTTANSYIPIDLTNLTGKYDLTVNASVSSQNANDYGYATVTNNTERVSYSTNTSSSVRFVYISGEQKATDYSTTLQAGQMYYLHLGYYKNASVASGDDKFTVNSISVTPHLDEADLYHAEIVTNSDGQAMTQLPYGRYEITELETVVGYEKLEKPIIVDFKESGKTVVTNENDVEITVNDAGEFVIENKESAKVIVHHYLKDREGNYTDTKVAEDELLEGKIGEKYTTSPNLDIEKYDLEKDSSGKYVLPDNSTGTYESGTIEVTYYYEERDIPLIVHHYIEGTEEKVPLKDGGVAEDENLKGKEGDKYTTKEISEDNLSDEYELVEIPENAEGTYEGKVVEVTYYYKKVERQVIINKYAEDGASPLSGVTFEIDGEEYTTNEKGQIELNLEAGTYEVKETKVPEGYVLPENNVTEVTITRQTSKEEINITNEKIKGKVIVHYYEEGTENKLSEDVEKEGYVGDIYATKEADDIPEEYEFVNTVGETSGEYIEGTIEVIYYYRLKEPVITSEITKESNKDKITSVSEEITYNITYKAEVSDYKGDAIVTIVDYLPYEIDEEKSNIAEGLYDATEKTITWEEKLNNIDTYTNGAKVIDIAKEISVVYKDLDIAEDSLTNNVVGTIKLTRTEDEDSKEDSDTALVEIPGTVIAKYLEEGTDKVLAKEETYTDILGNPYETEQKDITGYDFVRVDGIANGTIDKELIEVIYYYKLKDPVITSEITKGSNLDKITSAENEITYNISYKAEIKDYRGNGKVTIVDYLPSKIDIE